jgi:predicted oxidoreductase
MQDKSHTISFPRFHGDGGSNSLLQQFINELYSHINGRRVYVRSKHASMTIHQTDGVLGSHQGLARSISIVSF